MIEYHYNLIMPKKPKEYRWQPKEDVTAYELALCITILICVTADKGRTYDYEKAIQELPESARRHFEVVNAA